MKTDKTINFSKRVWQRLSFFSSELFKSLAKLLLVVFTFSYIKNGAIDFVSIVEDNFELMMVLISILNILKTYKKYP